MFRPIFKLSRWTGERQYVPKSPDQGYGIILPTGEIIGVFNVNTFNKAIDRIQVYRESKQPVKRSGWKYHYRPSIYAGPGCRIICKRMPYDVF